MSPFEDKLLQVGQGKDPVHSALTFLSDLNSDDRSSLRATWPEIPVERRKYILKELISMAEDNIDLDFRHVFLLALEGGDVEGRLAAIDGLAEDESRLLLNRYIEMVRKDPDRAVREAVATALGRFTYLAHCGKFVTGQQAEKLRDVLVAVSKDRQEAGDVRRRAVEALGYFHGDKDVQELIKESYERGGTAAESAVFAMGRSMEEQWQQVVLDELKSGRASMRYEAAHAAGEMVLEDALPFLVKMIDDRDTEVRLGAVWALGQIGGKPAAEALARALKSTNIALREAAQEAMDEISFASNPMDIRG
ncbi:MAG: HEAT repeat domain-containing protein [Chloroflexota bacterium]|nr:HEAT repeat domain-containing protein [Chloroflexota bacterium]